MSDIGINRFANDKIISLKISEGSRSLTAKLNLEKTEELIKYLQDAVNSNNGYHKTLSH